MRVLVVTTWFPSAEAPTEAPFNLEHCRAIARAHEVRVVHVRLGSADPARREVYEGFDVVRVGGSPRSPLAMLRCERQIRRWLAGADILHTMAFSSVLVAALAWSLRRRPWLHTEHWNGVVNPASVGPAWSRLAGVRHLLRLPHRLTGVTTQLADVMSKFGRPGATSVVPCVVPNERTIVAPPHAHVMQLVAVGGLIDRKRPLLAIDTVAELERRGTPARLRWAGDGPLRSAVEARIAALDVQHRVDLLGPVTPDQVFALFDDADLYFLPTAQENFFTSAAEALSAGRPVVAPAVGGFDDYATEENSVLVREVTAKSLADAITTAAHTFADVPAERIAAPIRDRFSRARVGRQFTVLYDQLTH